MSGSAVLGRVTLDRRQTQRRTDEEPALVASSSVFGREERGVLRGLERRRQLRRREDLARSLALLQEVGEPPL